MKECKRFLLTNFLRNSYRGSFKCSSWDCLRNFFGKSSGISSEICPWTLIGISPSIHSQIYTRVPKKIPPKFPLDTPSEILAGIPLQISPEILSRGFFRQSQTYCLRYFFRGLSWIFFIDFFNIPRIPDFSPDSFRDSSRYFQRGDFFRKCFWKSLPGLMKKSGIVKILLVIFVWYSLRV